MTFTRQRVAELNFVNELLSLVPEHGRTSCSDTNVVNGFSGDRYPRCVRCAVLEMARDGVGSMPDSLLVDVSVGFVRNPDAELTCPYCHARRPAGHTFCFGCGNRLGD